MNKLNIKIIILIVSTLFFVGTIGIIISMSQIDKQTEDTTTYYSATVTDVIIIDTGNNIYTEIYTEEYNTILQISTNITKNINVTDVKNLKYGQRIFFRIENIKSGHMDKVGFINIVSLKTETKCVFSLEEYNVYIRNASYPARIASVVLALLFLSVSFWCFLSIKKSKTQKTGDGPQEK